MKIRVAIAEDEQLSLQAFCVLIEYLGIFNITAAARNGEELLQKIRLLAEEPDIVLLDVNMPIKNGIETAKEIKTLFPLCKVAALSTNDDDRTVLEMLRSGCCAYLLKDIDADELKVALLQIHENGNYNGDAFNVRSRRLLKMSLERPTVLSDNERKFLKLAATDMTYDQIADEMHLAERTIDGYREKLFKIFNVGSRVGMVVEAMKNQIISL